jgi:hypothetical protein
MARPKLGPNRQPWKGIDANERAYNTVHNALVGIILDGVTGVSPDLGHRQIAPEKADEYLDRARRVLADFESQNPAPGGQRGRGQFWMENKIRELRRLLTDAEAVRSGARPQKQTVAPSHDAPPRSFTSAGGRTFTIGPVDRAGPRDPRWGELWPILYNGEQAGKLFQDGNYGPNLPWHASTRELYWKYASDAPTGVGFDVAAFATARQALDAWGRSADQILDWAEGKPVHTGYGHGPSQRTTREARKASSHSKPDQRAVDFFYKHAGYGYGPGETPEQGRRRGAVKLAKAEQEATARGWTVKWEEDPEGWDSLGDIDPDDVKEILVAVLYDEDGNVLGSLGSIVNPDRDYARVVEAELALEALP